MTEATAVAEETEIMAEEKEEQKPQAMPELMVRLKIGRERAGSISEKLTAAVVGDEKLWYFEAACSSSSSAHALMAALSDERIKATWYINGIGEYNHQEVKPPANPQIMDQKLKVPGWPNNIHFVACIDTSGELLLCEKGRQLWMKLRERLTTPTLDKWGEALIRPILKSGMVMEPLCYGLPEKLTPYIVMGDAEAKFDEIVGKHVRGNGLRKGEACE